MFYRVRQLQYNARPERPDRLYARKLQEVLGGQWGEISVMIGIEDVILAWMNPPHAIVSGSGATPTDSVGYPRTSRYTRS